MRLAELVCILLVCLHGAAAKKDGAEEFKDIGFEALLVTARPTPQPPSPVPKTEPPTPAPPTLEPTRDPTFEQRDIPTTEDIKFEVPTYPPTESPTQKGSSFKLEHHHHKEDCLLPNNFQVYGDTGLFYMKVAWFGLFFSGAFFAYAAFDQKSGFRYHHFRVLIPVLTSALTYLSLSQGLGIYSPHCGRQIFWARYIDWGITTPIMLYEICSLAYMQSQNRIRWIIGCDFLMVVCGFIGCWLDNILMCLYLGIGILMFLPAVYYLLANDGGLREGCDDDSYRSKLIKNVTSWTFLVWTGYPVVWAFCSGLEYWSVDRECMAYAILDILAKICWGFMIVNSPAAIAEVYASAGSERLNIAQDSTGPGLAADPMLEDGSML